MSFQIKAGPEMHEVNGVTVPVITAVGDSRHPVTEAELEQFGLTVGAVKRIIRDHWPVGKEPDGVFFNEAEASSDAPGAWGKSVYGEENWKPVMTRVGTASVSNVQLSQNVGDVDHASLDNSQGSETATLTARVTETLTNTVSSQWRNSNSFGVSDTVTFELSFLGNGGKNSVTASYNHTWGKSGSKSEAFSAQSSSQVTYPVPPHKKMEVDFVATHGRLAFDVEYEASLEGWVAIHYNNGARLDGDATDHDHYLYGIDVNEILRRAGLSTTQRIVNSMEVGFYTNLQAKVVDPTTKKILKEMAL